MNRSEKEQYELVMGKPENIGYLHERTFFDALEASLANEWKEKAGNKHERLLECIVGRVVDARDRVVAASVVQWLGTNCGFAFLNNCLMSAGYLITGHGTRDEDRMLEAIKCADCAKSRRQELFDLCEPH